MGIIAVFGGTFNPIHIGHIEIIQEVLKISGVKKLIIIPTKIPPHKDTDFLADEQDRVNMCRIVVNDLENVEVSDIELKRPGKSYTIDTIKVLKSIYPDDEIAITIGADMVTSFDKWKDYKEILSLSKIITFSRATTDDTAYKSSIDMLSGLGASVITVDKKISDISSSAVRNMILNHKDVCAYLCEGVVNYINDNRLYEVK